MEFKDILKKYWFLFLVTIALVAYVIVYCVQAYSNRTIYVNAKSEDGKSIVYTLNGENYYADDLYEDLYSSLGQSTAMIKWSKAVINASVEETDTINTMANNYYSYIVANNEKSSIDTSLKNSGYANGYDDLKEYCLDVVKSTTFYSDFFRNHYETYVPKVVEELKPRKVYHILVKVANVGSATADDGTTVRSATMTDEEQEKYNAVVDAIANGTDFKEIAEQYSDDSSASNGGYLGIYDTSSSSSTFVTEFANALNAAETGTITDPVLSEYGYHWIYTEEASEDELKADDQFMSEIINQYSYASVTAVKEKSDELGFEIVNEDLNNLINTYLENAKAELETQDSTSDETTTTDQETTDDVTEESEESK